ncbi:hypothetical protein BH20ACT6_BH20ACT6_07830 [soil metagenome]
MKFGPLVEAMAAVSRVATEDFVPDELLRRLCEVAATTLDADGAGVMAADGTRARFVHADGPLLLRVEMLQGLLRQGPCADAIKTMEPVVVADLQAEDRWPQFIAAALTDGLRALVALPLISRGSVWGTLHLYRRQPGPWSGEELAATAMLADLAVSYLVMAADRDAARAAERALVHRSSHDQLTGLPNRGLFFDRLEHALAGAHRRGEEVVVLFIDLDRFKRINDTLGHAAGDAVLTEVAARMSGTLREGDTLARLAGDEFVLLCENVARDPASMVDATTRSVSRRLQQVLAPPITYEGTELAISASVGVAVAGGRRSAEELLREADSAMYAAKASGRARVVTRQLNEDAARRSEQELRRGLAEALDAGQLELYFQPIVSATETDRIEAVEALLRWNHPRLGVLPADAFVQLAEETGTLPRIGHWVIDQACAQLQAWQDQLGRWAPGTIFCNVSPNELSDPSLERILSQTLEAHDLQPARLGLEIVEKSFSDPLLVASLTDYQQRGHPLSIDDFGTGYSSLSRLIHLPVRYAKIDQTFVAGLPDDSRCRALVAAVLVVAANLNLQIIAEGVEHAEQAKHLIAAGCPLLQGYHLAEPMRAEQLTAQLSGSRPFATDR